MEAVEDRVESEFALCFEPGTFIQNTSGLVFGVIWIEVGRQKFPFDRWTDFPVIILGWWLQSLADLLEHKKEFVQCSFMDGPYWFEISFVASGNINIGFFRYGKESEEHLGQAECSVGRIRDEMLNAGRQALATCQEQGWLSNDT